MVSIKRQRVLKIEKPVVIVDAREDSLLKDKLKGFGVKVVEKNLDVGDIIVSERVCFERKSFRDFVRSIIDKRLFEQVSKMEKSFEKPVLVIEGFDFEESRMNKNVLLGAIAFLISKSNVSIIFTDSLEDTVRLIVGVAKKEQLTNRVALSFVMVKKLIGKKGTKEFILASFPGIGLRTARKLLEKFGSLEKIFSASVPELVKAGLGKKKAVEFKKILKDESK